MNADLQLLADPQRQAPIAVVFNAVRALRRIGIAQIVVAVTIAIARVPVEALLILVPVLGFVWIGVSVLMWWRFTFCVVDDELRVTKGVVWKVGLTLPLERVQSASIEQGLVHRVINVVKLSVETAGSSSAPILTSAAFTSSLRLACQN